MALAAAPLLSLSPLSRCANRSHALAAANAVLGEDELFLERESRALRELGQSELCGEGEREGEPRWKGVPFKDWTGQDYKCALEEARVRNRLDELMYQRLRKWLALLLRHPASSAHWYGGRVPRVPPFHTCPTNFTSFGKQQSQADCTAFWPKSTNQPCVAYIVGIGGVWQFAATALKHGCDVHAFDPTVELRRTHQRQARGLGKKVTFHYAGLSGVHPGNHRGRLQGYGELSENMFTLERLIQLASATDGTQRYPDVLSIDCEGCEWAALEQIASTSSELLRPVKLFTLELHLSPTLTPPSPRQLVILFDTLILKHGFRLWWMNANRGYPFDQRVEDFLAVAGLPLDTCCYELAFVK